jgi:MYXO-CTERM domain-containing protein
VLALLLALLGVVWGPAGPASACSCVGGTTAEHVAGADVVFTGTLLSREVSHPSAPIFSSDDPALHVFAVDTVFKGAAAQRQGVVSAADGASCGLELSGEGPFVVFATRDAALPAGQYAANLCGGSGPLTAALAADLREFGGTAGPSTRPAPGSAGITGSGAGPWPWIAGGGVVLVAFGLIGLRRRRVLSGK